MLEDVKGIGSALERTSCERSFGFSRTFVSAMLNRRCTCSAESLRSIASRLRFKPDVQRSSCPEGPEKQRAGVAHP